MEKNQGKKLSKGWWSFIFLVVFMWIGICSVLPDDQPLTPQEEVASQFSQSDGRHYNLQFYIEDHLNDPDSFEHVKTEYTVKEDHILVRMTYRAKNRFNAKVLESVLAKVDLKTGQVLEIVEQ